MSNLKICIVKQRKVIEGILTKVWHEKRKNRMEEANVDYHGIVNFEWVKT